jgi:hypothetical protein
VIPLPGNLPSTNQAASAPLYSGASPRAASGAAPSRASGVVTSGAMNNAWLVSWYVAATDSIETSPCCTACLPRLGAVDDVDGGEVVAITALTREDLGPVECGFCPAELLCEQKVCEHCDERYDADADECPDCARDGTASYRPERLGGGGWLQ